MRARQRDQRLTSLVNRTAIDIAEDNYIQQRSISLHGAHTSAINVSLVPYNKYFHATKHDPNNAAINITDQRSIAVSMTPTVQRSTSLKHDPNNFHRLEHIHLFIFYLWVGLYPWRGGREWNLPLLRQACRSTCNEILMANIIYIYISYSFRWFFSS